MSSSLSQYICDAPFMKVLRGLYCSSKPRHLRDLTRSYDLSPGGVSDILRRLDHLQLVKMVKVKNRKYYTLQVTKEEENLLSVLFASYERALVLERRERFQKRAAQKLEWMDEAYRFFKNVKQKK